MRKLKSGLRVTAVDRIPHFNLSKLQIKDLTRKGQMPSLSVVHVTLPPRYTHAPIEHRRTEEWFLVLKGQGQGRIGRRLVRFKPGTVVYMPPGVPHQMGTGARPMEILAVFSPSLDARRKDADIHACHPPKKAARKHAAPIFAQRGGLRRPSGRYSEVIPNTASAGGSGAAAKHKHPGARRP